MRESSKLMGRNVVTLSMSLSLSASSVKRPDCVLLKAEAGPQPPAPEVRALPARWGLGGVG